MGQVCKGANTPLSDFEKRAATAGDYRPQPDVAAGLSRDDIGRQQQAADDDFYSLRDSKPAFEVRVGDPLMPARHYRIWADGRVEGFKDGELPVLIMNRIPPLVHEAHARGRQIGELHPPIGRAAARDFGVPSDKNGLDVVTSQPEDASIVRRTAGHDEREARRTAFAQTVMSSEPGAVNVTEPVHKMVGLYRDGRIFGCFPTEHMAREFMANNMPKGVQFTWRLADVLVTAAAD